jgi:PhnB protein
MKKAKASKAKAAKRGKVSPVPAGYHSVTPYLAIQGAAQAIEFYKKAFGAKELMRVPGPEGKVGHAEVRIGDSRVMLADEYQPMEFLSPKSRGGTTVSLHIYLPNVDAVVKRAVSAGAKLVREVEDQFYGDRLGTVEDPFGHVWHFATHVEDLSHAEMKKRAAARAKEAGG